VSTRPLTPAERAAADLADVVDGLARVEATVRLLHAIARRLAAVGSEGGEQPWRPPLEAYLRQTGWREDPWGDRGNRTTYWSTDNGAALYLSDRMKSPGAILDAIASHEHRRRCELAFDILLGITPTDTGSTKDGADRE
jgi:hypothetical protein